MGTFSIWHWLVVLLVVLFLFGGNKLRNLGGDLAATIKGFKKGMKEDGAKTLEASAEESSAAPDKADSARDRSA